MMKFRVAKSHVYWWPVTVRVPAPEAERAGQYDEMGLQVQFAPMPRGRALEVNAEYAQLKTAAEMVEHEVASLIEVVRDWSGVEDEAGAPVPFSGTALRQALQHSWFRKAVYDAQAASLNGEAARLGN